MKKHYFGIALFCSIMVVSAVVADFFRTPAPLHVPPPRVDFIAPPAADETRAVGDLSYTTESAVYYADQASLVVSVRLRWNGAGAPPKSVRLEPRLFSRYDFETSVPLDPVNVTEPFAADSTRLVTFQSRRALGGDSLDNYYVAFVVRDVAANAFLTPPTPQIANAYHVLVSYGDGRVRGIR